MLHQPLLVAGWIHLPQFLDAKSKLLRIAVLVQCKARYQLLGQRTANPLADQHIFSQQRHAASVVRPRLAITPDAHVAGGDTDRRAGVVIEDFTAGKARIDFHAQFLGLFTQPAADIAQRDDIIAVIVHQRRHHEIRQRDGARWSQNQKTILFDFRFEGVRRVIAPLRQKLVDADGIDNGA